RPEKNQYKYFISGQTDQWIDLNNQNYINIIKLPKGSYTLKILASNSDGIWSEEKSIQIRVKPPFWRTTAAYIIEILTLTIIVLLAIQRSRKKLIEENHRLTERQAWTEKLEEQQTELENKNRNILDSITYAKRIQMAIMPARARFKQILPSSFILYIPKDIVSGDFYWITEIDTKIFIVCADCTGHGVPGAFMSIIGYNLLRNITKDRHIHKASEILDYLNKSLIELLYKGDLEDNTVVQDGMDISICVFDKSTCVLEFAGALSRMLIYRDNQFITVKGDKYPVGLSNDQDNPYTNIIINVQPNDRFYMFSDGYSDQFGGENGKKLKFKRFKSYIEECQQFNLPKQGITLKKMLQQWQGNWEQVDDILVMGFDFNIYLDEKDNRTI
ncbi:MAG: SpoIIE family protein phosphatase, partial [Bacteroidales bacterium]|nr:SpoIIE family protein phosphatase [Bacteroidales bacterium]